MWGPLHFGSNLPISESVPFLVHRTVLEYLPSNLMEGCWAALMGSPGNKLNAPLRFTPHKMHCILFAVCGPAIYNGIFVLTSRLFWANLTLKSSI